MFSATEADVKDFVISGVSLTKLCEYPTIRIPQYQREYDWTTKEWNDLWVDLVSATKSQRNYFLGSLNAEVLADGTGIELADGQQRLTTLMILLAAARCRATASDQSKIELLLFRQPAGTDSLSRETRLVDQTPEGVSALRTVLRTSGQISDSDVKSRHAKALNFFHEKCSLLSDEDLSTLISLVCDRVIFARVVAQAPGSGLKMFERANTRGRPLTMVDKVKSLLIGASDDSALTVERWRTAVDHLKAAKAYNDATLTGWIAADLHDSGEKSGEVLRRSDALKQLEAALSRDGVTSVVARLLDYAEAVEHVQLSRVPGTNHHCGSLKNALRFLKFQQLIRILYAARCLERSDYEKLARAVQDTLVVVAFAKVHPPDVEKRIPAILFALRDKTSLASDKKSENALDLLKSIRDQYSADVGKFILNGVYTQVTAAHLHVWWGLLEQYIANRNRSKKAQLAPQEVKFSVPYVSVEHILPQNAAATAAVREFGRSKVRFDRQRIPNLTPLEPALNQGDKPFSIKRETYASSRYQLTRSLAVQDRGYKAFATLLKKYLPVAKQWNHEALIFRGRKLYELTCEALEIKRVSTVAEETPDSPRLESQDALPRVSSREELIRGMIDTRAGDEPKPRTRFTLRFLDLITPSSDDPVALTPTGESMLEASDEERDQRLLEVILAHPYVQAWKAMPRAERRDLLKDDLDLLFGSRKPTVQKQVEKCLNNWAEET
jgi:hypothetical protein